MTFQPKVREDSENLIRRTTSLSDWQTRLSHTADKFVGKRRIGWRAVIDNNKKLGKFRLYNVTDDVVVGAEQCVKANDRKERVNVGGWNYVIFTGVAKVFEIQWCDDAGKYPQGIQDAHIYVDEE